MNKILVTIPDIRANGGVATMFANLRLNEIKGVDYFFVTNIKENSGFIKPIRLLIKYFQFILLLRKNEYELIHVNPSLNRNSFYRDVIFIKISQLFDKKVIVFFHGWDIEYEKTVEKNIIKKLIFTIYLKSNKIIVLSKYIYKCLLSYGVNENDIIIETTVANDTNLYDKITVIENKFKKGINRNINILFLGRIEKEKGIYEAIECVRILSSKIQDKKINFNIAGEGPELNTIKKIVNDYCLKNINFLGYIRNKQKEEYLKKSHILIFPSYSEGLPLTVLESMLYGLVIVSSNVGGIPDHVKNGINGFITNSRDPNVYASSIQRVIDDSELFKKISETNHLQAKSRYTVDKVRNRLLSYYNELLS